MADDQQPDNLEGSQNQPNPAPKSVEFNVGGNIEKSVVIIGDNNVVQYYATIENNTEKHEPDYWALKHPYPMPPNFTGRIAERAILTHWLKEDPENRLFILRALGGFGKSALSWQWLTHDVDIKEYPKVVFWSFYEGDASFEHFIEETLKYLKLEVPQGQRSQVDELLKAMQSQKILLIMDGFERALRAYSSMNAAYQGDESPLSQGEGKGEGDSQLDCVNINAEIFLKSVCSLPNIKSKVLMTTRLTPRAVKPRGEFILGCREEELTAMQKAEAVEFFYKQKIKGTHAEIEAACAPYGYHPLSLRLLAGRILKDFENPADIVVAQKLKIDGDIIQQKHHVLEVSYNSLPKHEQKLLSTIACFRSPVELKTLGAISKPIKEEKPKGLLSLFKKKTSSEYTGNLGDDSKDLVERGLLHFDERNKKFDLHPIVRRYAYDHLIAADRTGTHERLMNYFEAIPEPEKIEKLEDLTPVIELYHHMVRAGNLDEAWKLLYDRLHDTLYYQFGSYQLIAELLRALFLDSEDRPPRLKKEDAQAYTFAVLANAYSLSGQSRRAVPLGEMHNAIYEKAGDKQNLAIGLGNVAYHQLAIGALREVERNLRRGLEIAHDIDLKQALDNWHRELGRLLATRGMWQESEENFEKAIGYAKEISYTQDQGIAFAYRALRFLLMVREKALLEIRESQVDHRTSNPEYLLSAIQSASRAFELADECARTQYSIPRDYVRAYWLLGAAYCAKNELTLAEENLSKALNLCRQINAVDAEADILLDFARLRYDQKNYEEAKSLADEALLITERCGYVLQGADVNLFLAQYALEQEKDKTKAKGYTETALKLAYCDSPPYYYKVAYHEAARMWEKVK